MTSEWSQKAVWAALEYVLKDGEATILRKAWVPEDHEAAEITLDNTNLHFIAMRGKLLPGLSPVILDFLLFAAVPNLKRLIANKMDKWIRIKKGIKKILR